MARKSGLSAKQIAFVAALVTGKTQEQAATAIGISIRQARRYYALPAVQAALRAAQDEGLAEAVRIMNAGSKTALRMLVELMCDDRVAAGIRLRAAQVWLEQAFRARELLDLTQRVAALEQSRPS